MRIDDIVWLPHFVDKLVWKHHVLPEEVEEVLFDNPMYRGVQKGHVPGEDLYAALHTRRSLSAPAIWTRRKEDNMPKSRRIPEFKSYEEMGEFWDTHSLADYWDQTEPAEFEISEQARRRYMVRIDREVLNRVQRLARIRGVSTESLVNLLLEQRLGELETRTA